MKDQKKRTKASRKERIEADQETRPIVFMEKPKRAVSTFQQSICTLYGPTKIGKTTFASHIPGAYLLATESGYSWLPFRFQDIANWPTFKAFIDEMEDSPKKVKTVSMWIIDTIDILVKKCMSTICYEWGLTDLSEEGFSRAWTELADELVFNILRLRDLGPGILMISHERQRESRTRRLIITKDSLDLSNSIFNAISYISDIILHMRYVDKSKTSAELGHLRCLSTRGSEEEDAGDRTGRLNEIIKFRTEKQAVRKVLECFERKE